MSKQNLFTRLNALNMLGNAAKSFLALFLLFVTVNASAAKPIAVFFNGPTICKGCADPLIELLTDRDYVIQFVTPGQSTPELLKNASVYVVPGGEDITSLDQGWTASDRAAIRAFLASGGKYLGICLGAYWAADWVGEMPGFTPLNITPAHVKAYSLDKSDRLINVNWRGKVRSVFFQDGPTFQVTNASANVLAHYEDGGVAAFISPYGKGRVAVSGVHIEAEKDWYEDLKLPVPKPLTDDLAEEFLDLLLDE